MNTMLENFINGNLATARKQAKRRSFSAIRAALMADYGYSAEKAALTAAYLKGNRDAWQAACDAP